MIRMATYHRNQGGDPLKLKLIISLCLPLLKQAAQLLRDKDENSTGVDDEAANAIDYALDALAKYLV